MSLETGALPVKDEEGKPARNARMIALRIAALVFVTGCAMIVAGAVAIALSLKLRQLHDNVQTRYPGPDYGD